MVNGKDCAKNAILNKFRLLESFRNNLKSFRDYYNNCHESRIHICLSKLSVYMRLLFTFSFKTNVQDFPGGAVVKNPPAKAGDMGLSPGPGRSHMYCISFRCTT